jgi:hypothetical protein
MLAGSGTMFGLFAAGWLQRFVASRGTAATEMSALASKVADALGPDRMIGIADPFRPYHLGGLEPLIWGLAASAVAGIGVSLLTHPPEPERIARFFGTTGAADSEKQASQAPS